LILKLIARLYLVFLKAISPVWRLNGDRRHGQKKMAKQKEVINDIFGRN